MKDVKILIVSQSDETAAGSRTRVFQYLPFFDKNSIGYKLLIYYTGGKAHRMLVVLNCLFHKTIFIQKIVFKPWAMGLLRLLRKRIIFDFDDALFEHPDYPVSEKRQLLRLFENSALIILENDYNKAYILKNTGQRNILTITGPIDTDRYVARPARRDMSGTVVIGWVGSKSTTPYLLSINSACERITNKYGARVKFKTIGADEGQLRGTVFDGNDVAWKLDTEVSELQEFDIGIMPLPDDPWTRGKGGYKLLQYMAVGIPGVCSPVGINAELIADGVNGFKASTEDEWFEKLSALIEDDNLRRSLGQNGRQIAENKFSFYHYAPILIDNVRRIAMA